MLRASPVLDKQLDKSVSKGFYSYAQTRTALEIEVIAIFKQEL
jgi:hypothetical protein